MRPDGRQRWIRRLSATVIAASVIEFLVATTGVQIRRLPASTDFATYYLAARLARDGAPPYDAPRLAQEGHAIALRYEAFPFLYPPTFAWALQPLAALSYARARAVWMLFATAALLAALALTLHAMWMLARQVGLRDPGVPWLLAAVFTATALNSTGVHNDIRAGSVGILLWCCFAGLAWALLRGRRVSAAIALALAGQLKLVPLALFPWFAWRAGRRAALVALGLTVLALVPAWTHWGPNILADYVRALHAQAGAEIPRAMNQSLDAFLSRLLVPSAFAQSPLDLPALKVWLSPLLAVALAAWTLRRLVSGTRSGPRQALECGYGVVALLAVMKITWLHTLTAALFVWPLLMVVVWRAAERGVANVRLWGTLACAGYFLSAAHLPVLWHGLRDGVASVAISAHLFGVLLLWWVCGKALEWMDAWSRNPSEPMQSSRSTLGATAGHAIEGGAPSPRAPTADGEAADGVTRHSSRRDGTRL